MPLSEHDRAVLAHVVADPNAWAAHALAMVGEDAIAAKVARHEAAYLGAIALPGYKTRAERDAELTL